MRGFHHNIDIWVITFLLLLQDFKQTGTEHNDTDLLKEHSFSAGAVFAGFSHAMVLPHYFGLLLQGYKDITKL